MKVKIARLLATLKQWLPYLDLWLDIGLLQVQTELWNFDYQRMVHTRINLSVKLFRKWGFRFKLYSLPRR